MPPIDPRSNDRTSAPPPLNSGVVPVPIFTTATESELPDLPGYQIQSILGRGGMGVVYQAQQLRLNRTVAIKMLHRSDSHDPIARLRFVAEAEAVAAIRHPNVVQVFEFGQHGGCPFLVMEFLSGFSLIQRIKTSAPMAVADAALLLAQVSEGVGAAHALGIIHRDLKPANVLFDHEGTPKVTDFGLAKRESIDLTHSHAVMGTPSYMAPEQAGGRTKFVGPAADTWALGVILFECLTGRKPFEGADAIEILHRVQSDDPSTVRSLVVGVSRDLDTICQKCLMKEPSRRYPTATDLASDLHRFLNGEPIQARRTGMVERGFRWARRKPTLAALYFLSLVTVIMAIAGSSAGALWRRAEAARADAVSAHDQLDRLTYFRTLGLAYQKYHEHQVAQARLLLEDCSPTHRQWEWHFVRRLCHDESAVHSLHTDWIWSVAWDPTGTRYATGCRDASAGIWNAADGTRLASFVGHADAVNAVTFSPDGHRVATASRDRRAIIWEASTGKSLGELIGHTGVLTAVVFHPDGKRVATGSHDGTVRWWEAEHARPEQVWRTEDSEVGALAINREGTRLAVGTRDGTIRIWDTESNRLLLSWRGHTDWVWTLAFDPTGSRLLSGGLDRTGRLWEVASGRELLTLPGHHRSVSGTTISPNGNLLATSSPDGALRIWSANNGKELQLFQGHAGAVLSARFFPDGAKIATSGKDGTVRIWDSREASLHASFWPQPAIAEVAAFNADASLAALGCLDGSVTVWDVPTRRRVAIVKNLPTRITSLTFRQDGRTLIAADEKGTIRSWDVLDPWKRTEPERTEIPEPVLFVLKEGKTIVAGQAVLSIFGPQRMEWSTTTTGAWNATAMTTDPVAQHLIVGTREGLVEVIQPGASERRRFAPGHQARIRSMALSPSQEILATASDDRTVRLWNFRSGKLIRTLEGLVEPIRTVAFSPDGARLITGGDFGTIKLWDPVSGTELLSLAGNIGPVLALQFSPDGMRILAVAQDDARRGWDVVLRAWTAAAR